MANITPFNFHGNNIAVETDEQGEPWFRASDVCTLLEFTNARDALAYHVETDDVEKFYIIDRIGRKQATNFINLSGLNSLILNSQLPKAKEFRYWVTSEVLPSIQYTGSFDLAPNEGVPTAVGPLIETISQHLPKGLERALVRTLLQLDKDAENNKKAVTKRDRQIDRQQEQIASLISFLPEAQFQIKVAELEAAGWDTKDAQRNAKLQLGFSRPHSSMFSDEPPQVILGTEQTALPPKFPWDTVGAAVREMKVGGMIPVDVPEPFRVDNVRKYFRKAMRTQGIHFNFQTAVKYQTLQIFRTL